ncbi:fasciclin domain-containing protein [Pontibacter akesuensis]|uniref:Uncaracterized surface protein containing fasciclin (FAS1) repeats n=1 Tax=Pontibacter akesuensis TaxID=388950 RepID=A0A1I7K0P7_9BACT|nr:fasciclin domain-containing protein [Pontibacter akesuensis]GHA76002.1 hypothetical protein GCM10007389_32410 [Pontibacter akesuensis]SFU91007.1 Uncaracterized surface protein containing fasciclin (FAS1) repeats [Pontibacter akesuensis]
MKKHTTLAALLFVGLLAWGCASTEPDAESSTTDNVTADAIDTNAEVDSQAPLDPDTDMSAEEPTNTNISANNELGRGMNIVALVQQNPELSTLLELIRAADMVTVLESPAPYTVFAPTNDAFAALPAGAVEALKRPGSKLELRRVLQSHILPNRIVTSEMKDNMAMKTAQGEEVVADVQGQTIKVGDATILTPNVEASNGVVHVIDKVLLPPQN